MLLVWGWSGMEWSWHYFLGPDSPSSRVVGGIGSFQFFVWFKGFGGMEPARVLIPLETKTHGPTSHCLYICSCRLLRVSTAWFPRFRTIAQHLRSSGAQELGPPIRPRSRAEISAPPSPEMFSLPHHRSHVARGGHRTRSFPCWSSPHSCRRR